MASAWHDDIVVAINLLVSGIRRKGVQQRFSSGARREPMTIKRAVHCHAGNKTVRKRSLRDNPALGIPPGTKVRYAQTALQSEISDVLPDPCRSETQAGLSRALAPMGETRNYPRRCFRYAWPSCVFRAAAPSPLTCHVSPLPGCQPVIGVWHGLVLERAQRAPRSGAFRWPRNPTRQYASSALCARL